MFIGLGDATPGRTEGKSGISTSLISTPSLTKWKEESEMRGSEEDGKESICPLLCNTNIALLKERLGCELR